MSETQKAFNRRTEEGWFGKYLEELGIDIGCGDDSVSESFRKWDLIFGDTDAQKMEGVVDESYSTVYASHILEHLSDPIEALHNWYRILKSGGYLIVVVPHRDLYEKKKELPSQFSNEHKTFWLPDSEGRTALWQHDTWSLRDTIELALPPEGWEIEVLRTLDTQYNSNGGKHPTGEYSIEVIVKKKMPEQPIHKALVTELLPPWKDKTFSIMDPPIEKHLREAGIVIDKVSGDVMIIWGLGRRIESQVYKIICPPQYLVFDCENPVDTEWSVRHFRKQGYELHVEMMERVKELQWGCKVMEKVTDSLENFVTVVVPTHNSAPYIEDCLKSILAQTHLNLEIILVDDASTDDTIGKARQLFNSDQRYHLIIPLPAKIPAGAVRQRGIDEAVGDFTCCFDSDDVMPHTYLEEAIEAFDEETDFVYPRSWWLIPEENFESRDMILCNPHITDVAWRGVVEKGDIANFFMNSSNWEEASKLGSCMIMPSVCRNLFTKVQKFDSELTRLQDWDMHLDLLGRGARGKGFICPPYIRNRSDNITNSVDRKSYERCRDRIIEKHNLPKVPKTLILPLNSNGDPEAVLAGPRIRGHRIAPHLPGAEIGDLNTLRYRWKEFDAFYFVCAPTPAVTGWVTHLANVLNKDVLFDVCVEYWSEDYQFEGYSSQDFIDCLAAIKDLVTFICSSENLARSLKRLFDSSVDVEVIEDTIMPSFNIKESYKSTGLVSWCGAFGNITSLLAYTSKLVGFTEKTGATVRLITDQMPLRLPFKWEWKKWSPEAEEQLIVETDFCLLPSMDHSSFSCKGGGKLALAFSLGMPASNLLSIVRLEGLYKSEKLRLEEGKSNLQHALNNFITPLEVQKLIRILQ